MDKSTPIQQQQPQQQQQQQQQQQSQSQSQQQQQQQQQNQHVLFDFSPIDYWDDIDDKIQKNYYNVKQLIANKTVKECQDIYVKHIALSPTSNLEEVTMGLLIAILVEPDGQQSRYYRDIVTLSRDGLALFSTYLNMLIIERLSKIKDHSIKQIFWITNQLMKAAVNSAETVCSNLFRQTAGGDLSAKNLWLAENLLGLLNENRSWLINSTSFMIPTTIYTFMRLIADHMGPAQSDLRKKEIDFVIGLVRERFLDCLSIGRDFLRLLYNIQKLPEFERLWNDIFNNPKSLHPTFQNPLQLLATRTPRRLFQSRLTFEMERKISFLATQVKFGNQKRYQDWFYKQFLSTPESLSLRSDLIRYICAIIHPSNEVLCSDIIPRWAIIGWLLLPNSASTTGNATVSCKLALFYDWLVYDPKMDNIMNIEPAILLMHFSNRSHPAMTASLLDYLCRIPITFAPKLSEPMKAGIKNSIHQILEKRVIQTISHLFDNPKYEPALRNMIRENFGEFCTNSSHIDNGVAQQAPTNQAPHNNTTTTINTLSTKQPEVITIAPDPHVLTTDAVAPVIPERACPRSESNSIAKRKPSATISQVEDKQSSKEVPANDGVKQLSHPGNGTDGTQKSTHEKPRKPMTPNLSSMQARDPVSETSIHTDLLASATIVPTTQKQILAEDDPDWHSPVNQIANNEDSNYKVLYPFFQVKPPNMDETLNSLDDTLRRIIEDFCGKSSQEDRCSLMDKLISTVFDNSEPVSPPTLKNIAHCIAYKLVDDFSVRIFPSTSSHDNESLEESICSPFFVLCRSAFANKLTHTTHRPMALLVAISEFLAATGFLVLYFLRVTVIVHSTACVHAGYLKFCKQANRDLTTCLYDDLNKALTYDSEMFCFLLPSVFGELAVGGSFLVTGNVDLIRLVVSAIDPVHLQELICLCMTSMAKLINKDSPLPIIEASLKWESWEQYCLWKLISAQNVPLENYITILPKLNAKNNAEALSCIMLNLQKVPEPTCTMVEQVMECDAKSNELFTTSILRFWSIRTDMKNLVNHIISVYESQPASPSIKRKGQPKSSKNSSLTSRNERVLTHLALIKARAPKNKLILQPDIVEMLTQAESLCNEHQRRRFADLLTNVPNTSKKMKKDQ